MENELVDYILTNLKIINLVKINEILNEIEKISNLKITYTIYK